MFKKHLNNNGSTMLLLVIITAILTILGTTILTLSITNYKMKVIDSREKKNFYLADTGLEIVEFIAKYVIKDAVESGNLAVEEYMDNLDLGKEIEDEEAGLDSPYIKDDGTIDVDYIKAEQELIFEDAYTKYIKENLENRIKNLKPKEDSNSLDDIKPHIEASFNDQSFHLTVDSSYEKDNITKQISCEYEIKIPQYGIEIVPDDIGEIIEIKKNVIWEKAIAADGDLKIHDEGLEINGDIFVKGEDDGGILLTENFKKVTINGQVITLNDLIIDSDKPRKKNVEINGDVYADNVIITENTQNSQLIVSNSVFTSDDLELNGTKSIIKIQNGYYGICDGSNIRSNKPDNSSSIIINSPDLANGKKKSKLIINNEVVILGSSYINAYKEVNGEKIPYQTGESLSIIGNYRAYTKPLTEEPNEQQDKVYYEKLKENNVEFEYYAPLVLVDKFKNGTPLNVIDKSQYFRLYFKQYGDDEIKDLEKVIELPDSENIRTIGAVITDNDILTGNYDLDLFGYVSNKFNETFKDMVEYNLSINDVESNSDVNTQINLDYIKNGIDEKDEENIFLSRNNNYTIDNTNNYKDIVITGGDVTINDTDFEGIIIADGNVYVKGKVNVNGAIISSGDIRFLEKGNKSISYDKDVLIKLIGENIDLFEKIFKNNSSDSIYILEPNDYQKTNDGKITISDLLILKNWHMKQ
ncbi:DUF2572 family protein [Thermohalobacter berrensis]|uniref:Type 4 fimbrial biogenesis protein PilX N-terminal domain-containing protein n=1 Tax=Thermohalobacter berrensis TaxID=99594 RepID=A0A419TAS6_9FIRM|nr:DUF2572 family protein [Thermohalobacter berrensis]RKD34586.1 hypothetical protein BET03_01805 [Thermohalobacter berrensis]